MYNIPIVLHCERWLWALKSRAQARIFTNWYYPKWQIVGQLTEIIVQFWIQAPKLAYILLGDWPFDKTIWPTQNSRWRPFFKMAAIEYTVILHFTITSHRLVLFEWSWCQIIHFPLCRIQIWIQIWTNGLTYWLPCTIYQFRNPNILLNLRFMLRLTRLKCMVHIIVVLQV